MDFEPNLLDNFNLLFLVSENAFGSKYPQTLS